MERIRSRAPASRWGGAALLVLGALSVGCGKGAPLPAPGAADAPASYVGWWRGSGSQNGIGSLLRLVEGGKAELFLCVMLDGTYALDGARLQRTAAQPRDESDASGALPEMTVEVGADNMTQRAGEQTLVLQRHAVLPGTSGPSDIVGIWSYPHYAGGTAYERYEAGGAWSMRLPIGLPRQPATWSATAAGLHLTRSSGSGADYVARRTPAGWTLAGLEGAGDFSWLGETLWHPTTQE